MNSRGWVIAGICVVQLAIIREAVVAVSGGHYSPFAGWASVAQGPAEGQLVEGGPHKRFAVEAEPTVSVDIGYADLTIETGTSGLIDVGLSASPHRSAFNASGAIEAHREGRHVRIVAESKGRWSTGDDRMVTLTVPADTAVTVVAAGDMHVHGLRGAATLNSVGAGRIDIEDFAAPSLALTTSDGSIEMQHVAAAHLQATSSDGRIRGTGLAVRDGSIEGDGQIRLGFTADSDTLVSAETDDGKISTLGFGADGEAALPLRFGAGDGRLDVRASDGDITLTNEGEATRGAP